MDERFEQTIHGEWKRGSDKEVTVEFTVIEREVSLESAKLAQKGLIDALVARLGG